MNTPKLHRCLKDALIRTTCEHGSLPERVVKGVRECLEKVHSEDFPDYLQDEYQRFQMHMNLAFRPGRSSDGSRPRVNMSREEARSVVDLLVRLLCEVETHRAPYDPTSTFLDAKEDVQRSEEHDWTEAWMKGTSS